jgi:hypothetical protein
MAARLISVILILAVCLVTTSSSRITPGSFLSAANTSDYWSSDSGQFSLGFLPQGDGFVLGIRFAQKTVIWTGFRNDPPFPADTRLILTTDSQFILQSNQFQQRQFTDTPSLVSSASLLNSGNFVLYGSNSSVVWQSFDFPTDTLLPGQRLPAGKRLVSSFSESDHSNGRFELVMQIDGNLVQYPLLVPTEPVTAYYATGTFTSGNNVSLNLDESGQLYLLNSSGINILTLHEGNFTRRLIYRLTLDADGMVNLYSHDIGPETGDWRIDWSSLQSKCGAKGICGYNEYCAEIDDVATCMCFPGFDKTNEEEKFGCKRNVSWSTNNCSQVNTVQELGNMIWLDNTYNVLENVDIDTCRSECTEDCNCEAAIYKDRQCRKQLLPLLFGRVKLPNDDQGIALVKVGSANFQTNTILGAKKDGKKGQVVLVLGLTLLGAAVLVLVISGVLICKFSARRYKHVSSGDDGMDDDIMLRSYKYKDLEEATNGFAEELGRGGFGTVYKGVLSNGVFPTVNIAVKKLKLEVAESEREFLNEVKIISRTHHKNLVQLLGYCNEGTNRILVYEYMSNGSLADFLFKSEESRKPKWEERFRIVLDIARGIMYLHEECRTQIIHCDIKPENILMDENGSAKIADFGVSKLLMTHQSKTSTNMRGTRGYAAPEWHMNNHVTTKADVYSFGIMLLEIVCYRRSLDMNADAENKVVLSEWVYECFKANELQKLTRDYEVAKTIFAKVVKVGLWCIQIEPSLRPSMKNVLLMLEGTVEIPIPPSPYFFS